MKYLILLVILTSCSYQAGVAWEWGRHKSIEENLTEHDVKMRKLAEDLEDARWGR